MISFKTIRKELGLNQLQMAFRLSMGQSEYSKLERNIKELTFEEFSRYLFILGYEIKKRGKDNI